MLKKIFAKVILVIAGFCVAILLAEVFVRIFYPECRDHVLPSGLYETDNYLGWKLAEDKSGNHHSKYFDVNYRTNSLGFRDKERLLQKDQNKFRILLYGDSQVFGWGIPAEDRFSNLLEKSLSNVEIWNLAIPAYGLDQQVLLYQKDAVDANVVIFYVSEYTLKRINYNYLYQKSKPQFVIDDSKYLKVKPPEVPGVIGSLVNGAVRWMYLPFFLEERISMFNGKPEVAGHVIKSVIDDKSNVTELEGRILLFAQKLTNSRNEHMIILLNSYSIKGKSIRDFCLKNGISYLDINFNEKKDSLILGSKDFHWNNEANEIIFRHIMPEMKQLIEEKSKPDYLGN